MSDLIRRGPQYVAALVLLTLSSAACGSTTEPEPDPDTDPESITVTAASNPVEMPTTVQLTATVQPAGAPQRVTWSSGDPDAATVDASGVVTPLRAGIVTITATSTADGSITGTIDLGIECPDPRFVGAAPTADATWENWVPDPICFDYIVSTDIDLNDETLSIEPGTVVGFDEDVRMRIRGTAGIVADGTEEDPIVLRGSEGVRGHWEGIEIDSDFDEHVLAHVWIEHTNGEVPQSGSQPAGLKLASGVTVRLEHSVMRASEGYGMYMDYPVEMTGEGANIWTENALGPVYTYASEVEHLLVGESVLTGNDVGPVRVRPNNITNTALWPYGLFHVEDRAGQNFNVLGSLTLGPGVEIRFDGPNEMLRVAPGGFLSAVGSETDPVLLTGSEAVPGSWGGIQFEGTDNVSNRLEHVIVQYGGGFEGKTERANVMVETDGGISSRVSIGSTILRRSVDYGIFVEVGTTLDAFQDNTLTQNRLGPILIDAPVVASLGTGNDFIGNSVDEIKVRAGTNRHLTVGTTWVDLGVPYYLEQYNSIQWLIDEVGFILEPGVRLLFSPGLRLYLRNGAYISAEGTQLNRIRLEAKSEPWGGILFYDAGGSFDYATISNGGDNAVESNVQIEALETGSTVMFTSEVDMTGATNNIYFGFGSTIAVGCIAPIVIPPGDEVSDHCRPPGG